MIPLLVLALAAPPEAPVVVSAEPDAQLTAKFRGTDGWVGGDGAFSVALPGDRALWLFSDTWVGKVRDGKRKDVALVNNTVGVQTGRGADTELSFHVQKDAKGKSTALFAPPDGKGWFWLFAGHHAGDALHVFLPRLEKAAGSAAFGFKSVDVWLGTVSNPDAAPEAWKVAYAKLPFADFGEKRKWMFGSSVLVSGDHAYVYGYEEAPAKPFPARKLLTARVPKDKLSNFDSWRFLSDKGEWSSDPKAASGAAGGLGTEFSVGYVPALKRYALVTTENGLSDRIVARFAMAPEGPWSDSVLLYTCPEMKKHKGVFTYAGKAHPHLAGDGELVVSYATNAFELGPVINNAELYWPNFVRVKLK